MEKLVVVGWGRMGLTHTSIINGLYPERFATTIVERDKKVALLTRASLGYQVTNDLSKVSLIDSIVLITTPPFVHSDLASIALANGAKSVFIEKPFGLHDMRVKDDPRISVGYVLRFTEVAHKLKHIIKHQGCTSIKLNYASYTLTKPPKGWRNSSYGGVLNEMGSHLIDLLLYILNASDFEIQECLIKSSVSDVDDIVFVKGLVNSVVFELNLNWVNESYRKPVWSGEIETKQGNLRFDQQSIDTGFIPNAIDYYVRGREFSMQMKHLIESDRSIMCSSHQANIVHDVITKIKSKA